MTCYLYEDYQRVSACVYFIVLHSQAKQNSNAHYMNIEGTSAPH